MNTNYIWANIVKHQNENFSTIRGKSYSYIVHDQYIIINNDKRRKISKEKLLQALLITNPTPSRIQAEGIWGPSYVYGIITDSRIK